MGKREMARYAEQLKVIGRRIAHVRKQLGMTQVELSKKADVSLKFMSMMESGANVSIRTLLSVSNALGVDFIDMVRSKGLPKKGRGRPAKNSDVLADPVALEVLRFFSLLSDNQQKRALVILRTAILED